MDNVKFLNPAPEWEANNNQSPRVPLQTAVLFLVFNRPDTTAQVFEAIRKARPPRLYVAADGARPDRIGESEKVVSVREIATAVDWPCEVVTLFRDENLGCKYAVSGAISWFFKQEEQGIILEDDCLPSQSFFWFCEELLEQFKENTQIMSICGTNINKTIKLLDDYYFSVYALMWGWATWRRAWNFHDLELQNWPKNKISQSIVKRNSFTKIEILTWTQTLDRTYNKHIDTWDYQWIYSCWLNNGLTVAPRNNLIRNLGFSDQATHTAAYDPIRSNLTLQEQKYPLRHPQHQEINIEADRFISKYWFHTSWENLIKSAILKTPGLMKINIWINKFTRSSPHLRNRV